MNKIFIMFIAILMALPAYAVKKDKIIKISVEPKEAAIYVNNTFIGNGYAMNITRSTQNFMAEMRETLYRSL